jgi:hypothetical protein
MSWTEAECDQWRANPLVNPKTRKTIKLNGPTYKQILKHCQSLISPQIQPQAQPQARLPSPRPQIQPQARLPSPRPTLPQIQTAVIETQGLTWKLCRDKILGEYKLGKLLGKGGEGEVSEVCDTTGCPYVLKAHWIYLGRNELKPRTAGRTQSSARG